MRVYKNIQIYVIYVRITITMIVKYLVALIAAAQMNRMDVNMYIIMMHTLLVMRIIKSIINLIIIQFNHSLISKQKHQLQ
jgi:hypothetical protein